MNTNKSNKTLVYIGQLLICIAFLFPIPLGYVWAVIPGYKYDPLDPTEYNVGVLVFSVVLLIVGIFCCIYSTRRSKKKGIGDDTVLNKIKQIGYIAWGIIISLCVLVWIIIGLYYLFTNVPAEGIFFTATIVAILIFLIRFGWDIFNRK